MENRSICSTWLAPGWWALAPFLCFVVLGDSAQALGHAARHTVTNYSSYLHQTKLRLPSASQSCLLHICRAQKPGLGKAKGPRKHSSNRVSNPRTPFYSQCWITVFLTSVDCIARVCVFHWILGRQRQGKALPATRQELLPGDHTYRLVTHLESDRTGRLKWDTILSRESRGSHACITSICVEGRLAGSWYLYLCMYWAVLISRQEVYWSSLHRAQGRGGACVDYISFLKDCLSSKIAYHLMHPHIKMLKMIKLLKTGFWLYDLKFNYLLQY